ETRLRISAAALGEKHPDAISALRDVAIAHQNVYADGYERSLPLLEKALALRTEVLGERDNNTLTLMTDLGNAYSFTGRAADGLAVYEKELRVLTEVYGPTGERIEAGLAVVAGAYANMGRDEEALPVFEKLYRAAVARSGEKSRDAVFNLVRLASAHARLGHNPEALKLMRRAMLLRKEVFPEKDRETIHYLEVLAGIYMNLGRPANALPLFAEAARLNAEDAGDQSFVALRSVGQLAHCHEQLGHLEEARTLNRRTLAAQTEVLGAHHPDTITSMVHLARVEHKLGHEGQARALYGKAIPAIEALRASGDLSPDNRQALFAQWVGAYKAYAGLLVAAGDHTEAFRIAELSKARTLLESTAMRYANQSAVLTVGERGKAESFERRIAELGNSIVAAKGQAASRLALEADKNKVIAEFAAYRRELAAKHPKYAQLTEVKVLDAAAGPALLADGILFVSYLMDGARPLAFTLSSEGLQARPLEELPSLGETIDAYRKLILAPAGGIEEGESVWKLPDGTYAAAHGAPWQDAALVEDVGEIGRYLAHKLLEPLAGQLSGVKQVIVSADGALAALPFETLPLDGKPLIAGRDVAYVQSLSMLALLKARDESLRRRGENEDRKDLLAMGNAIYEADPKGEAPRSSRPEPKRSGAKFNLAKMLSSNRGSVRGVDHIFKLMGGSWPNLPGTGEEIAAVTEVFGPAQAAAFTQQDATEAKLRELNRQHALRRFRYLLFSAHGFLSLEEPALSALVLGQVNKAPGTDGYITAAKWPGYELSSDLVVLSACETGLGKVIQGEGVMGLPYALYVAGNKNTLLSLWPVVDESTAEFMKAFFAKLKAGMSQSAALGETKREFLAGSRFSAPVYWAPFVLYGY
ncbi:MAG TPA: CHAT domain-containing tetratricopeptide repeat protein, partial [Rhodomicrobium sp.]|nr:CHAT domain-containing tetratricopeptide repeat protein [Rhodomicrobium sp.]